MFNRQAFFFPFGHCLRVNFLQRKEQYHVEIISNTAHTRFDLSKRNILLVKSLHTSQAAAYPGFREMKKLGVFTIPLEGMVVHRRVTPSIKFAGTHLYSGRRVAL